MIEASHQLVDRVAAGDRAAFWCLCTVLSKQVWQAAILVLPGPHDARAVTRATFLEVWHLARHHANDPPAEVGGWVTAIATRRIDERRRALDTPCPLLDEYDRHVYRELAELLPGDRPTSRPTGVGSGLSLATPDGMTVRRRRTPPGRPSHVARRFKRRRWLGR